MRKVLVFRARDERGMTTAEYAVGTVATVTGVGALVGIFSQPWFQDVLKAVIQAIIQVVMETIG